MFSRIMIAIFVLGGIKQVTTEAQVGGNWPQHQVTTFP